jgi:hypothetical protein
MKRLRIPETVRSDAGDEVLSVVVEADGRVHVTLRTDQWDDPAAWGILLVDVMRHVARAYGDTNPAAAAEALARVKAGFDAEWGHED